VRALRACGAANERTLAGCAELHICFFGSVSEPVTMFEGVFSLPPGHRMLVYVPDRRKIPRRILGGIRDGAGWARPKKTSPL